MAECVCGDIKTCKCLCFEWLVRLASQLQLGPKMTHLWCIHSENIPENQIEFWHRMLPEYIRLQSCLYPKSVSCYYWKITTMNSCMILSSLLIPDSNCIKNYGTFIVSFPIHKLLVFKTRRWLYIPHTFSLKFPQRFLRMSLTTNID